ncbi:membrane bound O-acyl transferase family-domain-containing protein [Daldinia loculata]|uniref:membrane bound O-acyl transferase family-domain-containing protein n=1 Tax=Daldinia loculata TaxID=103429 RepID=UPI0020C3159A|nr:membrane bound O-acyl transferase family-domain-containing protein [Daldinia loculata]KAI1647328.1 membrane bound O-acyl transferase family-domain-containing protein [Daldinia loculata]
MGSVFPNTELKEPDSSIFPHVLLWICQIVALTCPPFRGRRLCFASLIIALATYCNAHPHFTNDFGLAQPFSLAWSFYMAVLSKLMFSGPCGPEERFWRANGPTREAQAYSAFGWKKMRWAAVLMFNQRGIRWNHQVKNIPGSPKMTRSQFLAAQLGKFIGCLCMADLLFEIHRRLNLTSPDGQAGHINSKHLTIKHHDWRWSLAKTFSFAFLPYFMLSMQYAQGAFIFVLFKLSKAEDWPPAFGAMQNLVTVRRFWGSFWHQQLRHMFTSYTDVFADSFGIRRGTNLSSYTKLYLAFLISGCFHALGQLHLPRPSDVTSRECSIGFLLFFLWQAVAITVEDITIWAMHRNSASESKGRVPKYYSIVGYVWVFLSMWWSLPLVGDAVLKLRVGTGSFLPFPLTRPFVEAYVPVPP